MALIQCSECGKEISDRASACPGCGAPIGATTSANINVPQNDGGRPVRVERAGFRWEAIGAILLIAALVIGLAGGGAFAGLMGFVGLIVFIIGRFID